MKPRNLPVAIVDIEASGLQDGYPLELGWAIVHRDLSITSDACLLAPDDEIVAIGAWDPDAEALHGLSLADCRRDGVPYGVGARRLLAALYGIHDVYTDAPETDCAWLSVLAESEPGIANLQLRHVGDLYRPLGPHGLAALRDRMRAEAPHRAEPDARGWAEHFVLQASLLGG